METSTPTAHGTTAPAQSNSILERLRARDAQRIAGAVKRAEEAKSSADPQECVAAFLEQFAQTHSQLELSIASAVSNQASKAELDGLAAQVAELEQNVAGAAYFLPPYDLRQVTNNVTALKASIDAAVVSVQPKAKFSFSSKVKAALKPAPVPATSANNNSQTPIMTTDTSQQPPSANKESEQPSSSVTFADKSNETINVPRSQIQGQDVMLTNLTNCIVCLPAPLAALFVHGLRNCTIVTGPVAGATYIEDVQGSSLYISARQVRIHTTKDTTFYLRVLSNPIIEHTSGVHVAPYVPTYPGWREDFSAEGLEPDGGKWAEVHDFGWLRATKSPHWDILPENKRNPPLSCCS